MKGFLKLLCLSMLLFSALYSKAADNNDNDKESEKDSEKPLKIGNFALPTSQQPGPLISFGQNIIDEGQNQIFILYLDFQKEHHDYDTSLIPSYLYAFRDDLSIFLNIPVSPRSKQGENRSSGLEDVFVQLEYAFYTEEHRTYIDQVTFVGNFSIPSGSKRKTPPTGNGAPAFFFGFTATRTMIDWYLFTSHGGIWTASHDETKFGDQFLYQFGIGRNIANFGDWLFLWMVEFDGIYSWKDRVDGHIDPNSGGNQIIMTPSLWLSSEHIILQLGVGFPIQQHFFGEQSKNTYSVAFNIGWTF